MKNQWWPEITDIASASSAARQGFWAALLIFSADTLLGAMTAFGVQIPGIDATAIIDGLIFGFIAIGLWKRLRTAAVVGLLFFIAETAVQGFSRQGPWAPLMALILLVMFINSVRGTFRYRTYTTQGPAAEPSPASRSSSPLLVVFSILRATRSMRRRIFGKEMPHWAEDLSSTFLSRLNVLQLVPTAWAILFFPAHFFWRVPSLLRSEGLISRSPYRTPIGFGIRLVVFAFALDQLLYHRVGIEHSQQLYSAAFCLGLPLILAITCLIFWCVIAPCRIALRYSGIPINSAHFLVILDPASYRRVRLSDRFWGFVYYYGYAALILQIVTLFTAVILFLAFDRTQAPDAAQTGAMSSYLVIALILLIDRVFIVPYSELLRANVEYPTRQMHKNDIQQLTDALASSTNILRRHKFATDSWSGSRTKKQKRLEIQLRRILEGGVQNGWMRLQRRLIHDRRIEKRLDAARLSQFRTERSSVYRNGSFTKFAQAWQEFQPAVEYPFVNDMLRTIQELTV